MRRAIAITTLIVVGACHQVGDSGAEVQASPPPQLPTILGLGTKVDSVKLAALDIDAGPSGAGLPAGSGTPAQGLQVYAAKCASCHGAKGEGLALPGAAAAPKIIGPGAFPDGNDAKTVRTVGNYWPYATTLYDYVHRAMPLKSPGSLKPDEVYAVVAYLLSENQIIARDAVIDAKTLPAVKMPAAGHFVVDDRRGKTVR
jgi:mono/diheme cytochrome c family protein